MVSIIILSVVIIPMLIMAVVLLGGRGSFLISGFNSLSPAEQAKYDQKALCRFVGGLLIWICFFVAMLLIGAQFAISWMVIVGLVFMILGTVGGVVYANSGKRFLRKDLSPEELVSCTKRSNASATLALVICAAALISVGALYFYGSREPVVHISDSSVQIGAMYGTAVRFENISDVTLIEQSMRQIGAGRRTNGFDGGMQALRGHFTSGLLFVQADSSPTIRIERSVGADIFISLRDGERTELLYYALRAALD